MQNSWPEIVMVLRQGLAFLGTVLGFGFHVKLRLRLHCVVAKRCSGFTMDAAKLLSPRERQDSSKNTGSTARALSGTPANLVALCSYSMTHALHQTKDLPLLA